jgi:hypothetical protein
VTHVQCQRCQRPTGDQSYVCEACVAPVVEALLTVPGLVDELPAAIWRQTRYGSGGVGGWQEPWDQRAQDAHDAVTNALTTVARDVAETRGMYGPSPMTPMRGPTCRTGWGCAHRTCHIITASQPEHPGASAARWLAGQVGWLRHRPDAGTVLEELRAAVGQLRRVVDRPPDRQIVGVCECGEHLYGVPGRPVARCRGCGRDYDVESSRAGLRAYAEGLLLTAAEIATLALTTGLTASRDRTRNLVNQWATRSVIVARGIRGGEPVYRTGEVLARLAVVSANHEAKGA